jgi:hypothetical protein
MWKTSTELAYVGLNVRNRAHAYIGSGKRCGACSQKTQCTSGRYKYLAIHIHEPARECARELAHRPEFGNAQRQRKKVEALFAELNNQIVLRRLRLRRLKFVREQFFLAAVAQNIKRLVRFLSQPMRPVLPLSRTEGRKTRQRHARSRKDPLLTWCRVAKPVPAMRPVPLHSTGHDLGAARD